MQPRTNEQGVNVDECVDLAKHHYKMKLLWSRKW